MTLKRVERSSIGLLLFKTVDKVDGSKLFNQKNDLILSLFLAFVSFMAESDSANSNGTKEFNDVLKYLATLPNNESYNNLPRRWTDEALDKLLGGTSALSRAMAEKKGLISDYDLLSETFANIAVSESEASETNPTFPSLELFDQMLAAVGSRAFQSLGEDEIDAMIPLLDLFNHKRGVGAICDVSYTKGKDGSIHVIAKHDLKARYLPGITYGAKGNAQLLLRYGFTIQHNIEPDGSSNDILDLKINGSTCSLRTGPKSYTYGCFVKMLELVKNDGNYACGEATLENDCDDGPGSMEDFLNSCEEEDDENFDFYNGDDVENEDSNGGDDTDEKQSDNQAIESLKKELKIAAEGFSLNGCTLVKALQSPNFSRDRFCAYLVASEVRTIGFYLQASDLIQKKLSADYSAQKSDDQLDETKDHDRQLLHEQALELRDAFYRIRYPDF